MFASDAYPELVYAAALDRVRSLERDRIARQARSERARLRRARLLQRWRHTITGQ